MKSTTTIGDRYSIEYKLGQGGSSITYGAIDNKTNQQVAIKALSLKGLEDWKKIELFEREAKILQQLNHPAIPKYIDYFQIETEGNVYFYIVQQLAPGQSLAHLISEGWQPEETKVKNIAEQILDILIYLQQLTPPVIHRDIKPQNIIYQPDTGKLFLVDFGAVQDTYHHTVMGSTVVGTYGYMAPEQYRGGAVLSTDLYSLGCTLLFLLTGESPAELPQKKLKINFRNAVNIKRDFANWIDKLIEPNVNNRFPKAESALLVLHEKQSLEDYHNEAIVKPRYSSIKISQDSKKLIIDIPSFAERKRVSIAFYFWLLWVGLSILNRVAILLSAIWIGKIYIIIWFYNVIFPDKKNNGLIIQYLFLILFIVAFMLGHSLSIPLFSMYLIIIDTFLEFILQQNFVRQLLLALLATRITFKKYKGDYFTIARKAFNLWHKKTFKYITNNTPLPRVFLTPQEQIWLQAEIDRYLKNKN